MVAGRKKRLSPAYMQLLMKNQTNANMVISDINIINDEIKDEINDDENNMRCSEDCKKVIFETHDSNDDTNQDTTVISTNPSDRNSIRTEVFDLDIFPTSYTLLKKHMKELPLNLPFNYCVMQDKINGSQNLNIEWSASTFLNEVSKEQVSDSSYDQR